MGLFFDVDELCLEGCCMEGVVDARDFTDAVVCRFCSQEALKDEVFLEVGGKELADFKPFAWEVRLLSESLKQGWAHHPWGGGDSEELLQIRGGFVCTGKRHKHSLVHLMKNDEALSMAK